MSRNYQQQPPAFSSAPLKMQCFMATSSTAAWKEETCAPSAKDSVEGSGDGRWKNRPEDGIIRMHRARDFAMLWKCFESWSATGAFLERPKCMRDCGLSAAGFHYIVIQCMLRPMGALQDRTCPVGFAAATWFVMDQRAWAEAHFVAWFEFIITQGECWYVIPNAKGLWTC